MLNPNLKTVFHEIISLTRFEGGHAESAIIHSGLQNTQQAGGKLPFTANPILSIGCITIPKEKFIPCSLHVQLGGGTFSPFSGHKTIAMTSSMTSSTNVTKIFKNSAIIF
jgi:hypothetical protein